MWVQFAKSRMCCVMPQFLWPNNLSPFCARNYYLFFCAHKYLKKFPEISITPHQRHWGKICCSGAACSTSSSQTRPARIGPSNLPSWVGEDAPLCWEVRRQLSSQGQRASCELAWGLWLSSTPWAGLRATSTSNTSSPLCSSAKNGRLQHVGSVW